MKRILLFLLIITVVSLGSIAFFGGVHFYTYSTFIPVSGKHKGFKGEFKPCIYPVFTKSGTMGLKCIVPYLFYRERTSNTAPMVVVSTHDTFDNYGYEDKSQVVLETVTVQNERGESFLLVSPEAPMVLSLLGLGSGSGTERLGVITGKEITISAKGNALTTDGKRENFVLKQTWIESHSSSVGLGISFGE